MSALKKVFLLPLITSLSISSLFSMDLPPVQMSMVESIDIEKSRVLATASQICMLLNSSNLKNDGLNDDALKVILTIVRDLESREIGGLARLVRCQNAKELYNSIKDLVIGIKLSKRLLPYAVHQALKRDGKSILMKETYCISMFLEQKYGPNILHLACKDGNVDCVQIIVDVARLMDDPDRTLYQLLESWSWSDKATPLMLTAKLGKGCWVSCMEILINSAKPLDNGEVLASHLKRWSKYCYELLYYAHERNNQDAIKLLRDAYDFAGIDLPSWFNS